MNFLGVNHVVRAGSLWVKVYALSTGKRLGGLSLRSRYGHSCLPWTYKA